MNTRKFRQYVDSAVRQPVPRRTALTAGTVLTAITGLILTTGNHATTTGPIAQTAASADLPATVAVDGLNVRQVAAGQTKVNLTAAPLATLAAGTALRVRCQFTGTTGPDGESRWYAVSGPDIPKPPGGGLAVAFASYVSVAKNAAVPDCGTQPRSDVPAEGKKSTSGGDGKAYVAMGDSFSSGEGAGNYQKGTDVKNGDMCHRSQNAYAILVGKAHPEYAGANLAFVACSGATTENVTDTSHSTEGPQVARTPGLGGNTVLVTISVGGNDIGFAEILTACLSLKKPGESCKAAYADETDGKIQALGAALQSTYNHIKERAPKAHLFVIGYPKMFHDRELANGGCLDVNKEGVAGNDDIDWMMGEADKLNAAVESATEQVGGTFVDVSTEFAGHDLCGSDSYFNGVVRDKDNKPTAESCHPNAKGQRAIAKALLNKLG